MYFAFLPALLPVLVERLDMSLVQVGLLASVMGLSAQLTQPLFGYIGDRVGRRGLAIAGPLLTAVSMSCIGLIGSFPLLLLVLILAGLGTAIFHPQGAALTSRLAGRRSGMAMAVFAAGGNVGFGLGPVLVISIVAALGLPYTLLAMPIGLAVVIFLAVAVPRSADVTAREHSPGPVGSAWRLPMLVLFLVVMLRAAAAVQFTSFVPILLARRGADLMLGGWTLLGFSLAGGLGGLLAGLIADSVGRRRVTVVGLALAAPALFLFLRADGVVAAVLLTVTGLCLFSALPVNIVMAQELLPGRTSAASGLVMGLAWGIGGLSTSGMGALADHLSRTLGPTAGLAGAMDWIAVLPAAAALLALALPETGPRAPARRG